MLQYLYVVKYRHLNFKKVGYKINQMGVLVFSPRAPLGCGHIAFLLTLV